MPANFRFWRNVVLIGAAHVVAIAGLMRWSHESGRSPQSIVWMSAGTGGAPAAPSPPKLHVATPAPHEDAKEEKTLDEPLLASAKSDIQLPLATPTPSPRPTPSPTPSHTPKPEPSLVVKTKPRVTPRKPKPKPSATPKPSPKRVLLVKATPPPKPKATPEEESDDDKKEEPTPPPAPVKPSATPGAASAPGKGGTGAAGGRGNGSGTIQAQFGWYGSMLHDRFYSEWVQPTSVAASGAKNSALVKLRIEKDGRISNFEIVRSSGNDAIDESVRAAARRVTHVDPLPAGLGSDHYDVKIVFELNSE